MFFMPEDIKALIEASKPKPKRPAGTAPAAWTDTDTDALIERISAEGPKRKKK